MHEEHVPTARDNQTFVAGDALSGLLVGGEKFPSQPLVARGVCLSKDGVGLIPAAAKAEPTPLDPRSNASGRNTNIIPTESLAKYHTEDSFIANPTVIDASIGHTNASLSSVTQLEKVQNFTPHSFLSVRLLGAGGFSTVDEVLHRPTNLRLGRKTLKNRDPSAIEELKKEVGVLQKLRHPHIIRFLGAYSNGGKMSILVSPVAETTLALWLDQTTLQQPANFVNVVSQMFGCLLSSIRYLHEQRPVVKHMDIKPQNILVAQGNQKFPHVVLCDFGISSSDDLSDGQHKPLTRRYIAPEVLEGFTREKAADIWSLGCVFAEMASAPFAQSNSKWLNFRRDYSGRTGKHYWQDVPDLQDRLSGFLEEAATPTEQLVVGSLKDMLHADPNKRPSAAILSLKFTPAPCCLEWSNDNAVFPAPDQELEAVETLVHQNSVDCCDHLVQTATVTDDHSPDVFKNAKYWIEECYNTHEACRQNARTDKTLPTRLIDTQPEGIDDSVVRIVDSASIIQGSETIEYATLSYVWKQTDVTLTTDGFQNTLGLQRHSLSKSLESGIQAAQSLGYRYIWADSLCILQDSEDDRRSECAKMASVFRNAALTIVLDQLDRHYSEKPVVTEVIPSVVLPNANANALTENAHRTTHRSAVAMLPLSNFTTPGFGWDTRVWALQERLLSHRLLHVCERQLYWECSSLKASDTFPQGLSSLVWEKAHNKSTHERSQRGKPGSQSVIFKNVLDRQTGLEPTRLRNCQWIHKEGNGNNDSMTAAHTTMQLEEGKAPLSSRAVSVPEFAPKNSDVAATSSANVSMRAYDAGSDGTTVASNDQTTARRPTSPYLRGLFALSSGDLTSAHPPLSKVYRGSESAQAAYADNAAHHQFASICTSDSSSSGGDHTKRMPTTSRLATANTKCDSLAHTLAHQLASGTHSHPCASLDSSTPLPPTPAPTLQRHYHPSNTLALSPTAQHSTVPSGAIGVLK